MREAIEWMPSPKVIDGRVVEPWQTLGGRRVDRHDPESVEAFRRIYECFHAEALQVSAKGRLLDHLLSHFWLEPFESVLKQTQVDLIAEPWRRLSTPDGYFLKYADGSEIAGVCDPDMRDMLRTRSFEPMPYIGGPFYSSCLDDHMEYDAEICPGSKVCWCDLPMFSSWDDLDATAASIAGVKDIFARSQPQDYRYEEDHSIIAGFIAWAEYWLARGHPLRQYLS